MRARCSHVWWRSCLLARQFKLSWCHSRLPTVCFELISCVWYLCYLTRALEAYKHIVPLRWALCQAVLGPAAGTSGALLLPAMN